MILISDLFSDEYMERLQRPGSGLEHGEVSDGPIACPLCTKTFTLWSHYEAHKKCHQKLKQRQYPCQTCGKVSSNNWTHMDLSTDCGHLDIYIGQQQEYASENSQGCPTLSVFALWSLLSTESSPPVSIY